MSVKLKEQIHLRQQAFHANKSGLMYKYYRNAVNKERKRCKAKYYTSKVKDLKGVNPRQWWSEVNKLSGSKRKNSSLFSFLNVPEYQNLSPTEVANSINHAVLEPLQPYMPIESERVALQLSLEENPEFLEVSVQRVYNNLLHLNKHKAPGPDGLSNWVLKEYAEIHRGQSWVPGRVKEALKFFGDVKEVRHQQWSNVPGVHTGTRLVGIVRKHDIPRNIIIDCVRCRVWYKGQPLVCDICNDNHKAADCPLKGKCKRCREAGHFVRNCPKPVWYVPGRPETDADSDDGDGNDNDNVNNNENDNDNDGDVAVADNVVESVAVPDWGGGGGGGAWGFSAVLYVWFGCGCTYGC